MVAPKLRFRDENGQEFGAWEMFKYSEAMSHKSKKYNPSTSSSIPCIELEHIEQGSGKLIGFSDAKEQKSIKNIFNEGDVLFGKLRPYLRKYILAPFDGVCSSEIWVLKGNKVSNQFLFYMIQTESFIDLSNKSTGSKMPRADWSTIAEEPCLIPSLPEQTKIANFLSAVDERIQQLSQTHELLTQYKKGVMQKIFSQELRFKDENGEEFPKWNVRKFSDFFTIGSSKRVLQDDWVNEGVPFYRTRELVSLSKKEKFKSEIFITEDNYNYLKDKYGTPAIGDFLVSGVGTLGIIHQIKNDKPFYFKDGNVLWFKKNNQISSNFFYHVFKSPKVITQVVDHAAITTVGTYTIENAKKTKFMCPSLDEQTKIANFLSAIDDKIDQAQSQLTALQEYKRGLLQQMFA